MSHEFTEMVNNYGFLCLNETKLDRFDSISVDGYKFISSSRINARIRSGGIGLLYKTKYDKYILVKAKLKHTIAIVISKELFGFDVLLLCVYIPPEGSAYHDVTAFEELKSCIIQHKNDCELCVMGDFNARTAELEDFVEVNNVADSTNNPECDIVALIEAGFCLNRSSQDKRTNNAGYNLLVSVKMQAS